MSGIQERNSSKGSSREALFVTVTPFTLLLMLGMFPTPLIKQTYVKDSSFHSTFRQIFHVHVVANTDVHLPILLIAAKMKAIGLERGPYLFRHLQGSDSIFTSQTRAEDPHVRLTIDRISPFKHPTKEREWFLHFADLAASLDQFPDDENIDRLQIWVKASCVLLLGRY